jgi:hypothetical protein
MRIIYLICLLLLFGCTEPYLLQTKDFEEALVIEATLTNELKIQEIKLSKTYKLEENGPEFVEDANIVIEDDLGTMYSFVEADEKYESTTAFQAIPGRKYKLTINVEGKTYVSTPELLSSANPIQSIENNDINYLGVRGVEIKVKAFDPTNSSKYYRYEYEETYKIIAPRWIANTVNINTSTKMLIITPRTYEARVCYSTKKSDDILVYNTTNLSEDRVDYMVRFIPVSNPIIMHRYSILVKQYVQNLAAHTYYNTLKKIAKNTGSILSQNQPGFFSGNITCQTNPNEKVIGFFDVSTVSSQRIFFNFEDVFPNTMKPDYFYDCFDNCLEAERLNCPGVYKYCFAPINCSGELVESYLNSNPQTFLFFSGPDDFSLISLVPPPCGDCTTFSSNIIPPFWR